MEQQKRASPSDFVAALKRDDRDGAVSVARGLLAQGANLGPQWRSIALFAAACAEWTLALGAMRRFVSQAPEQPEWQLAYADLLAQGGRLNEAVRVVQPLISKMPRDPRPHHFLGTILAEFGESEPALEQLRLALGARPSGLTWLTLAGVKRFTSDDPDLRALIAAEPRFVRAAPNEAAPFLYALGKAYSDIGEVDLAFAAYAKGAAIARQERKYEAAADLQSARHTIRRFEQVRAALSRPGQALSDRPIFVTGLPRSGTTLIEQMLASHSAVHDGGELNILRLAAEKPDPAAIRRHYLHLLSERFGAEGRLVDKSLNTSRFAGLLKIAMPTAPIVWLRRDPVDVAWSCFRTYFSRDVGWSFGLEDIGAYFAVEDMLRSYWRDALGGQLLLVDYEELVADAAGVVPRILHHCELQPEAAVFDFHDNKRAVRTASVAQVRQPLHAGAVSSATPFRSKLAPFVESYERSRRALGLPAMNL